MRLSPTPACRRYFLESGADQDTKGSRADTQLAAITRTLGLVLDAVTPRPSPGTRSAPT
ncbi:hypothetical protein [Streptosporangium carneum]|uniref:hypothetical protein n=1 Tax=Streptosporangium carneum TaxID=47481 RepID=UPI0022F34769|nr:hypothetical protein [Streptosporangium carneum]